MKVIKAIAVAMLFLPIAVKLQNSSAAQPKTPLNYSCPDGPSLSVTASTTKRDGFPDVRLVLTDPHGKQAGFAVLKNRIPKSRYHRIAEIPKAPERSRALAVEICDPEQGIYSLSVEEHTDSPYRLTFRGVGSATTNAEPRHLIGQIGHKRTYSFRFAVRDGNARIVLLNDAKEPLEQPMNEW